ncbi:receptor-type tyrosine-protein phosphatase F isoform X1 [Nasonia vitripennis]|uniref:protein-tyrosine-phosphatase n=1 Tax=Nasonia vitripennis TaxID=7425 RepID=A0A7M7ILT2_NASVI|nr:receptor-type tyrosine-protein phosphatase F isoform X1 [Nasonia vitripennis]XP_016836792.1 receptor-type tyrosine-protein phosphatase F isoform X1 [Nasonia vitripennis]
MSRLWLTLWLLLGVLWAQVCGEFFILSNPAALTSSLYRQLGKEMYCVTDDVDSALVWNDHLNWNYPTYKPPSLSYEPVVVHENTYVYPTNDNLACSMSSYKTCTKSWKGAEGSWYYTDSLHSPMAPIFDNRWEDFTVEEMTDRFANVTSLPNSGSLAVSVRGSSDAHFAICNGFSSPEHEFCFFVLLGGWKNTKSIIRKCERGIAEPAMAIPIGSCLTKLAEYDSEILSTTEWRTFVLKWDFRARILIEVYDSEKRILRHEENRPKWSNYFSGHFQNRTRTTEYSLNARSRGKMLMKFHKYSYSMTRNTQAKLSSPEFMTSSSDKRICVEMSFNMCPDCIVNIDVVDRKGYKRAIKIIRHEDKQQASSSKSKNPYGLRVWNNVKIDYTLTKNMSQPITLEINTLLTNNTYRNTSYWALSNVRRCYDDGLKYVKIDNYQDYNSGSSVYVWPNVTCQKISEDGVSEIISTIDQKIAPEEHRLPCEEGRIGKSCLARCSTFFPSHSNCQNLVACDKKGCSCAPGYKTPTCSDRCPESTYGYDCAQTCGHCAYGACSIATGACRSGCVKSNTTLFFLPDCKKGVGSPPAPLIEPINYTCVRVYLSMQEEYEFVPTILNFEIWLEENMTHPFIVTNKTIVRKNDVISAFAEPLSPGIKYKAIGVLEAENRTFRGSWANFTTECTESAAVNFIIKAINETSLILDINRERHVIDSCPDKWYHVEVTSVSSIVFNGSTSFPKIFIGLEPFTMYAFLVKSAKSSNILSRYVRTLEGAPSFVSHLESVPNTVNKITLNWRPPEKPNGKIVNYTVEIQPIESHGCKDFGQSTYNLTTDSMQALIRSVIKNELKETFSFTFNGLRPYTTYLVTVYASTSARRGEEKVLNHTTNSLKIPTEIFSNLHLTNESNESIAATIRWNPPSDCWTNTGPIRSSKLIITKLNKTLVNQEIQDYYYPLEKKLFYGTETYEIRVCSLRSPGGSANESACAVKSFTMPAREPMPIQKPKIIEVDTFNHSTTLRWQVPKPPLNGKLKHYTIKFCDLSGQNCEESAIVQPGEFCKHSFWISQDTLCKTVSLPSSDIYELIQITAYNEGVPNGSKPVSTPVIWEELTPSAPRNLVLKQTDGENSSVSITWHHPLESGGRIVSYYIHALIRETHLKHEPPTKIKQYSIMVSEYQSEYSTNIDLLPSTAYHISVAAITQGNKVGYPVSGFISLPSFVNFSTQDLKPRPRDDVITIDISIPEVVYDVKDSIILLMVQGTKYCDEDRSNKDVDLYLDEQNSAYYKASWIAANLTKLESYANKHFIIGDGKEYGGFKNHPLCPKESYIVHLMLVDGKKSLGGQKSEKLRTNILKSVKTNPISIADLPKNYAMWLTPLFFIILIAALLAFVVYRKKLAGTFIASKPKPGRQENMPLSNDLGKKKSNDSMDEVETGAKVKNVQDEKEIKDIQMNNMFIVEKKKEFAMPVKVEDFENYFEKAYKASKLKNEYSMIIHGPTKSCAYGSQSETKPKNRYANLFPYDESRVVLDKLSEEPFSDYINANFITGYGGKEKAYIATQGPKPNTIVDFWRMIWQENVQIICMMANLVENDKIKCEQYWPSAVGKKILYGTILVQFSSEEIHSDYTYRTFKVYCGTLEARTIEHLHYTAWPDHGVPSSPRSIVAFLQQLQRHAPFDDRANQPPIVVHCSAGVGRTGTLIVLDICLHQAFCEKVIYVFENLLSVRQGRLNMVDNTEQYLLVHLVLVEYFHTKDTCFSCDETLPDRIEEAKKKSSQLYQRILDTSWWNEVLGSPPLPEKTLSDRNRAKHRFPETAASLNRLYLKRSSNTDNDSDYIAATSVRGIFKDCQYITTQLPMPTTLADFWRMLSELNVEYVLALQLPDLQDPTYCELIADSQEFGSTKYLKIIRQQSSTTDSKYYLKEEVLIIDSSEQPSKEQRVKILSYKNWPEFSLPPVKELVQLWKAFDELPKTNKCPIVIACANGVTASGIWLASSFLLKRMTVDKECDVPQAVQAIRRCRKDFLSQPKYLEYLYDVALACAAVPSSTLQ